MTDGQEGRVEKRVLFAEVPPDLHEATKVRAIEEGRAVARLIEDAVRRYLDRPYRPRCDRVR